MLRSEMYMNAGRRTSASAGQTAQGGHDGRLECPASFEAMLAAFQIIKYCGHTRLAVDSCPKVVVR